MAKRKMECIECGDKKPLPFYEDPRDPPNEEGECLCLGCVTWITEDVAFELRHRAKELDRDVKKFKKLEAKQKKGT